MKNMNLTIRIYILIVLVPLFFLCMIRNLKYLAPFSLLADLFVAICVLTTMYYSISQAGNIADRPAFKSLHGLIQFVGVLLYSIDGVGITLPVENNMKKPLQFPIVLQIGWSIVILSVTLTGFFGYLGWGETCKSPITIHMPLGTVTITLQFLMCAVLTVTFAVNFWVPFRIVWHYIGRKHKRKRDIWERFYRGVHVILVTGLAVAYPNLIRIMVFLGNFFLAFIAFIFPAFVESLVFWSEPRKRRFR
ncbi:proton-coupled amino acid transporter-like protein CG1139 [Ostrinia furnacalis]|nr:proton-coupled amino acid transporter-like protein CG1139 [Ostrinia furnacalis]